MRASSLPRSATLLALTLTTAHSAGAAGAEARVAAGSAGVLARRHGSQAWKPIAAGASVPASSEVKCDDGCGLVLPDGAALTLAKGSSASLLDAAFAPVGDGQKSVRAQKVELREGALDADATAEPGKSRAVVVVTPDGGSVAIGGGRLRVVAKGDHSVVAALSGNARLSTASGWSALDVGQAVSIEAHKPASAPRPFPTAPAWSTSGSCPGGAVALAAGGVGGAIGVCWQAASGAARYRVEIAKDAGFAAAIDAGEVDSSTQSWVSKPIAPGRYFARVLGIDAEGVAGESSKVRAVGVVQAMLPAGAGGGSRALVGADGETVGLLNAGEFEVAMDQGPFTPPPAPVAVGAMQRKLRIRCKGEPDSETSYTIDRRAIRAEVKLAPKLPRWPGDPIDVVVSMVDPSGRTDTAAIEPRLGVVLGLEVVPVLWTHEGSAWKTHIEPMLGRSPTVLRVIATDANGVELGRGFVEIDKR